MYSPHRSRPLLPLPLLGSQRAHIACMCLLCAIRPTSRPTQQSLSQAPDNIIAGRRAPLRSLGIADERHTQLVDVLTQVPMRAARFGGIREVGWLVGWLWCPSAGMCVLFAQ